MVGDNCILIHTGYVITWQGWRLGCRYFSKSWSLERRGLCDFAMKLTMLVEAGDALLSRIQRELDGDDTKMFSVWSSFHWEVVWVYMQPSVMYIANVHAYHAMHYHRCNFLYTLHMPYCAWRFNQFFKWLLVTIGDSGGARSTPMEGRQINIWSFKLNTE